MMLAVIAFVLFMMFDLNKILWNNNKLNNLFTVGIIILGIGSYQAFLSGRTVMDILSCMAENIVLVVIAIYGLWKTCAVLFFELPFDETYKKTDKLPLIESGAYKKCRHPGFWFLLLFYVAVCGTFMSRQAVCFTITVNLLNLLYIILEDVYVFPKTIEKYDDYKKRVPFLVPRR
ncbi:MAG: hypothetical protein IKU13_10175 [Clostridia bacterium]|nr:hypothetical protein [Clostridia bacterium]